MLLPECARARSGPVDRDDRFARIRRVGQKRTERRTGKRLGKSPAGSFRFRTWGGVLASGTFLWRISCYLDEFRAKIKPWVSMLASFILCVCSKREYGSEKRLVWPEFPIRLVGCRDLSILNYNVPFDPSIFKLGFKPGGS